MLLPLLLVFGLLFSSVPSQAIDLGACSNYIIRVTPEAKVAIEKTVLQYGGKIGSRYQYVFDGFLVKLPDVAVGLLKKLPTVLIIEKDIPVSLTAIQKTQSPTPSWGLDRVDQREKVGTTSAFGYRSAGAGAYLAGSNSGSGIGSAGVIAGSRSLRTTRSGSPISAITSLFYNGAA
jgi:hypothetical protein